jgi:hypothetical protein
MEDAVLVVGALSALGGSRHVEALTLVRSAVGS